MAETLVRVLPHVDPDPETQQAWIDYAQKSTFEHFCKVVRTAERLRAEQAPRDRALLGFPCQVERARRGAESNPPMFVTSGTRGNEAASPMFVTSGIGGNEATSPMFVSPRAYSRDGGGTEATPPTFVTARYAVWMDDGEHEVLGRAIDAVRGVLGGGILGGGSLEGDGCVHGDGGGALEGDDCALGDGGGALGDGRCSAREIPIWVCLDALLDHFVGEYDGVHGRRMRGKYPLFKRDGWQCRVPGCRAYGPLHMHHIVFRAHGGGDEAENLVTLCDFHHRALHDGWIRCVGRAPVALYWELGVDRTAGPAEAPVARIAGDRRLTANEYWDGVCVRPVTAEQVASSRTRTSSQTRTSSRTRSAERASGSAQGRAA